MRKVLLVDENQLFGKLVDRHLCEAGCEVQQCCSPFSIVIKIKDFKPDVVLLDWKMPGKSISSLLERKNECRCKTILFSSDQEYLLKEMVAKGLADGYFIKNHSFDGLIEAIDRVVGLAS